MQAFYVLTGENASYRGVARSVRSAEWKLGAFELPARGSVVDVDPRLFRLGFASKANSTTRASEWGVDANWYLNRNFKLQIDWEHTGFANAIDFGGDLLDHENVLLMQFQIAY